MTTTTTSDLTYYRNAAQATRNRRQAAGRYTRPTQAQVDAFAHLMQRDGRKSLTKAECDALATHPHLTVGQRQEFAIMSMNWEVA